MSPLTGRTAAAIVALCSLTWLAAAGSAAAQSGQPLAPELTGLGPLHYAVTTANPRAQRFFDQGLRLLYAFNHTESLRAFQEAARLDPSLAMAHWGQAMVLGPNLNAPLTPENGTRAYQAIRTAFSLLGHAAPHERDLVQALAARYAADPKAARAPLDRAYADAMRTVAARYPADPEVQTIFADAVMNTMPWDYWMKDGTAKPDTQTVISTLERVIAAHPDHPGAHHYFIHVLEASNDPDRAVPSAERLGALMPGAGHMVHMPAHIFLRVGRYAEAADANVRAIAADEGYLAQCQAQGLYPYTYYPHNLHFLWAAATLEGRSQVAVEAARSTAAKVPHHHAGGLAWTADFPVTPLLAYVRFGKWREILLEPSPPARDPYANGIWHYARALASIAEGRRDRAQAELAALTAVKGHEAFTTTLKDSPFPTNLEIASRIVSGELAAQAKEFDAAVRLLTEAVALEDAIPYNEPPVWHHPVRQVLGAVLIEAGRAGEAERVYREDLARVRENGWSLFGLMRSLELQGRTADAAAVRQRFDKAWARADVVLSSSRILTPSTLPAARSVTLSNGVVLEYVEQGDAGGVPVVLLHGVTDSWRSFEHVMTLLPRSVRVFAISQRGHGRSSRPAGYRFQDFADDVRLFMDAKGIAGAVVAGHSMGGAVAQRFAVDFPERTLGLVLAGTTAVMRGNPVVKEFWETSIASLTDPVSRDLARAFQESTIAQPIAPPALDTFVNESLEVPAHVWKATFAHFVEYDAREDLRRIASPTLVVWGDRDTIFGRAEQEAMTRAITGARLVVYDGAGHALHWEQPERFAGDLTSFIRHLGGH